MKASSVGGETGISLPKSGGAIKGIGETFRPDLFTGTGNHAIPIATSPGRNGFGPSLSLQYSSGNGNGAFGLGWALATPRITRKTEKGLPRYNDDDVFVLTGAEDLVPLMDKIVDPVSNAVRWLPAEPLRRGAFVVTAYRPRTEGLFARIERWLNEATGVTHWRSITKDNITSLFGQAVGSRLSDPVDPLRVYEWLLDEMRDAYGNRVVYEYAVDAPTLYTTSNPAQRLPGLAEQNRVATQRYLRRILYANLPEQLLDVQGQPLHYGDGTPIGQASGDQRYALEVVFDYGDWDIDSPSHPKSAPGEQPEKFGLPLAAVFGGTPVPLREDRFSSCRPGFEVRTLRLCRRVLMYHHFAELGGPTLVRSTDFTYRTDEHSRLSLLVAATVSGHRRPRQGGEYRSASMPPVEFRYAQFEPHIQRYQSLVCTGGLPARSLNHPNLAVVDLFGDGLPDFVEGTDAGWRYWRNLGDGQFDQPRTLTNVPGGIALGDQGIAFGDMAGDGRTDLLVHLGSAPGFFEATANETWQTFKRYDTFPSFDLGDPGVRLVDLTGDGRSDALLSRPDHFVWFQSLGEQGFGPPQYIPRLHELDQFPDVYFDETSARVRLADMNGDGLVDIVVVHDGRIEYWPNLGYGRFGSRVVMERAPQVGIGFDPRRMHLADLTGTGAADVIYMEHDRVHFWLSQSGNAFDERQTITGTPLTTNATAVHFSDVLGSGTTTVLWSNDFAGQHESHYKALDFCGGRKPYVLEEMDNNLGATTKVLYGTSTRHYLRDQAEGLPWITTLPFPVQVVDKVEVIDHVARTKLVTSYRYHHGYFDGREREFRGFGRVDQFDTEAFNDFICPGLHGNDAAFDNGQIAYHAPPIETRSWFHSGIYFDGDLRGPDASQLLDRYKPEFYQGDTEVQPLAESVIDVNDAPHQAHRALRGSLLRGEVYGRDGSPKAAQPYTVTESRQRVRQLQPSAGNHHAVFHSHTIEQVSSTYERIPADPRITHSITLEVDEFGNVLRSLALAYGRRRSDQALPTDHDRTVQARMLITCTEGRYTNALVDAQAQPDTHRVPMPCEARSFELTGYTLPSSSLRFSWEDWVAGDFALLRQGADLAFEQQPSHAAPQRRLVAHSRVHYRADDLSDLLPLGQLQPLALPGQELKLALTPALIDTVYEGRLSAVALAGEHGYVHSQGDEAWWGPSPRVYYAADPALPPAAELDAAQRHFFLVQRTEDPFGHRSTQAFDPYCLFAVRAVDALANEVRASIDYRVLQPALVTDPNGNRSAAAFDTLGLLVGTAVMGKAASLSAEGDTLEGFVADVLAEQLDEFLAAPRVAGSSNRRSEAAPIAHTLLAGASSRFIYDLHRYQRLREPAFIATINRETHVSDIRPDQRSQLMLSVAYSDGFGRTVQTRLPAEPGPLDLDAPNAPTINPRWVVSGWVVLNNKGKPVRQFEPFFSDTHRFQPDVESGVSPVLFYDAASRVVATLHPNHTYEKVLFSAWHQTTYDVNDTCAPRNNQTGHPATDPDISGMMAGYFPSWSPNGEEWTTWYTQRISGALGTHQKEAAEKAGAHADTPEIRHFDALGRTFLTTAQNRVICTDHPLHGTEETFNTRVVLDITGNERQVRDAVIQADDALGRIVMVYSYEMLGSRIHQLSMEAGARWTFAAADGKPIHAWDSRGHKFTNSYDALRRPVGQAVRGSTTDSDPRTLGGELRVDLIEYGEAIADAENLNLRTRVFRHFDSAGVAINARLDDAGLPTQAYDFKGNLLCSTRRLARDYKAIPDWALPAEPQLEAETFEAATRFDALNRAVQSIAPHSNLPRAKRHVTQNTYNEANLLDKIDVWLERSTAPALLLDPAAETPSSVGVFSIDYDAKGQRRRIDFKNGASTVYRYDPFTFRLAKLLTKRQAPSFAEDDPQSPVEGWPGKQVQNLHYTYDPAGNITHIQDDAQQAVYFRNQYVEPSNDYVYDALNRLIQADGREHLGQLASGERKPPTAPDASNSFHTRLDHPGNGNAMGRYTERYVYDAVGNFLQMQHRGTDPAHAGWLRVYEYLEASLTEGRSGAAPTKTSNRLTCTMVNASGPSPLVEPYTHNAHGSMVRMPHLGGGSVGPNMHWDYKDQLRQTDLGGGGKAWYVYDASGQRVRKVWMKSQSRIEERIYLGGFEIFRKHGDGPIEANTAIFEHETLHVMDYRQRMALVETRTFDLPGDDQGPRRLVRYQFGNHLRSANLELDIQGQIISYEEYAPYGSSTYQALRSRTETAKRVRFSGKERDQESGFQYFGARYLVSHIAIWASSDPIGILDSVNTYSYVRNAPTRFLDSVGTNCSDPLTPCDPEQQAFDEFSSSLPAVLTTEEAQRQYKESKIINKQNSIDLDYFPFNWITSENQPTRPDKLSNLTAEKIFTANPYYRNRSTSTGIDIEAAGAARSGGHLEYKVLGASLKLGVVEQNHGVMCGIDLGFSAWNVQVGNELAKLKLGTGEGGVTAMVGSEGLYFYGGYSHASLEGEITSQTGSQARVGVSAGPSGGGRVHWSDDNGDGYTEYGLGIEYGPISADVKVTGKDILDASNSVHDTAANIYEYKKSKSEALARYFINLF